MPLVIMVATGASTMAVFIVCTIQRSVRSAKKQGRLKAQSKIDSISTAMLCCNLHCRTTYVLLFRGELSSAVLCTSTSEVLVLQFR
jgi:hypothetical protein